MEPLRIVQVTPYFGHQQYGGTERFVMNLSKELVKRGHYIDVFTTKSSRKIPYQQYFHNMTVHRFYSPWDAFGINPTCIMLHKLLKVQEIDVFHVHSYIYFTSIQAAIAKLFRHIPILLHIHGGVGRPPYETSLVKDVAKVFFDYTLGRFVLSQADLIASVSGYDASLLKDTIWVKPRRVKVVNNAIDMDMFPAVEVEQTSPFVVSFIGDLEPWKGIEYYQKTVKRILKERKEFTFWFIGNGSYYNKLQSTFKNEERVKIFGPVNHSQIPSLLSQTNVLVQPSFWEGSPTTIIEAMAMGIPVIGSSIGDIPRLLSYGKSGSLFPAGSVHDLTNVLVYVYDNYLEKKKEAKQVRTVIRNEFSFSSVAEQIERFYYRLREQTQVP